MRMFPFRSSPSWHVETLVFLIVGDNRSKFLHPGKKMLSKPSSWGVVISNEQKRGYVSAFQYAQDLFALSVVPERITHMACLGANRYDLETAGVLKQTGITIVFDGSKQTPYPTPADGLVELVEENGAFTA